MSDMETEQAWARYFAHQLTPGDKAESRARMLSNLRKAKEEGVFREMERWRGRIKWSISLEELRKE